MHLSKIWSSMYHNVNDCWLLVITPYLWPLWVHFAYFLAKMNFLKVGLSPKKNYFVCFEENPLQITKNAFCFTLNALFVLKIFKFLSWFFGQAENWLIRKIRLISKFMTSQPGWQTIAIHILPNISLRRGN